MRPVTSLGEQLSFLRRLAASPLATGALAPSGRALARLMASFADPKDRVLELGAGTGALTGGLLTRGVKPERIVSVEYSAGFCALLRAKFPAVTVIEGDAYDLDATLPAGLGLFDAAVSGLPLRNIAHAKRKALIGSALDRLKPGAPFVQFTYAPGPPHAAFNDVLVKATPWVLANLPPARVWIYRRL